MYEWLHDLPAFFNSNGVSQVYSAASPNCTFFKLLEHCATGCPTLYNYHSGVKCLQIGFSLEKLLWILGVRPHTMTMIIIG